MTVLREAAKGAGMVAFEAAQAIKRWEEGSWSLDPPRHEGYQMTRPLRELEHELLREIGKRLVRFGFSTRPKGQTFHRDLDGGWVGVHLSFIEHENDINVTVGIAIRFDAVENLVHCSNKLLSK